MKRLGFAFNPTNDQPIPIFIADYVLMGYGTGAIMAVPAHDQRDFEFCRKYGLPIRVVVQPVDADPLDPDKMTAAFDDHQRGKLVNSGPYDGLSVDDAVLAMSAHAQAKDFGQRETIFRLRDWGISRQRYWGTPIPIVYCPDHGIVPVPEKDLPVLLPIDDSIKFNPEGRVVMVFGRKKEASDEAAPWTRVTPPRPAVDGLAVVRALSEDVGAAAQDGPAVRDLDPLAARVLTLAVLVGSAPRAADHGGRRAGRGERFAILSRRERHAGEEKRNSENGDLPNHCVLLSQSWSGGPHLRAGPRPRSI